MTSEVSGDDQDNGTRSTGEGFSSLNLDARLLKTLSALGYEEPTDIQREAIPPLLAGSDVLGQAATGTGKTAAFALPMLQLISAEPSRGRISALVLVPTRELAMQVAEAVHRYGKELGTTVLPIYGGQSIGQQLRVLRRGVDVVVGTPGRVLDHIGRETLKLDALKIVILDEADEMLDMGFSEDLEAILENVPKERQTALFSATMPPRIAQIAGRHLKNPVRIAIAREKLTAGEMPRIRQLAYITPRAYKQATLGRVLDMENPTSALVFCRTRIEVDELTENLNSHGYRAEALHGGLSQEQRDRVMNKLRNGHAELLIATDVAARGLDIEHISHVVNYDVPSSSEVYIHRIGRTGRAGRAGVAITLLEPRERRLLKNIEHLTKRKIELGTVPTVADLRARRLELTRASIREAVLAGDLERYRAVIEALSGEFDVLDIAAAAVKLVHTGDGEETEEQDIPIPKSRPGKNDRDASRGGYAGEYQDPRSDREGKGSSRSHEDRGGRASGGREQDVVRLYVSVGRMAGIRPGDLVGAFANEAGIEVRSIGSIEIGDRHSVVEVPAELAEHIIDALRSSTLRGKPFIIRRFRER